jgi:hypothetical protein
MFGGVLPTRSGRLLVLILEPGRAGRRTEASEATESKVGDVAPSADNSNHRLRKERSDGERS